MDNQLNKGFIELHEKLAELNTVSAYIKEAGTISKNAINMSQDTLLKHKEILSLIDSYINHEESRILLVSDNIEDKIIQSIDKLSKNTNKSIEDSMDRSIELLEKSNDILEKNGNYTIEASKSINDFLLIQKQENEAIVDNLQVLKLEITQLFSNVNNLSTQINSSTKEIKNLIEFEHKNLKNISKELIQSNTKTYISLRNSILGVGITLAFLISLAIIKLYFSGSS